MKLIWEIIIFYWVNEVSSELIILFLSLPPIIYFQHTNHSENLRILVNCFTPLVKALKCLSVSHWIKAKSFQWPTFIHIYNFDFLLWCFSPRSLRANQFGHPVFLWVIQRQASLGTFAILSVQKYRRLCLCLDSHMPCSPAPFKFPHIYYFLVIIKIPSCRYGIPYLHPSFIFSKTFITL